ncbi:MAG: 5-formyltetrahydrofolate cyclo-ligase [Selenomonadaceae bacterium]|nr:5-formyltetrahydrofolate cyclo-ligase [Selenomonadaceae bacterium]
MRREMLSRRKTISLDERDKISRVLVEKFLSAEIYRASKVIMAYASTPEEIQLEKLFVECLADGKILAIPLIVGKGEMQAVIVPNMESLEVGAFNIMTVKKDCRKIIEPAQIDCVIVPGAAFDVNGNRLGLGGGFYDRFLPRAVNAVKVAFAYDFQVVDDLPTEIHDAKVDIVITAAD